MNKKIIYLKEVDSYDDILKKEYKKLPLFFKKIIFLFKNIFNIVTKKSEEEYNVWIIPIKEKYSNDKLEKILKKNLKINNNIYVISKELEKSNIYEIMDMYGIKYVIEEKVKKLLLISGLEYIAKLKKKDINSLDVTILVKDNSDINLFLIEEIAKLVKNLKIVSINIYKFRKLEEKLYNELGIAIQFSNSYKKSLERANIIINFDYSEIEINEYNICNNAIIINCTKDNIKIKSRLFEGININSYDINMNKEIVNTFKKINIYENYNKLILYASIIEKDNDFLVSYNDIEESKVSIIDFIGNKGIINNEEFKNITKKLDKNKKKE